MELNYKFHFKNEVRPLSSLSFHEVAGFDCPPGYVLPLQKPDAYALYYVYEGKGCYTLAGKEFPVAENDIFAMYPGAEIHCRSDKEEPWSLYTVSFNGADARLLLNAACFDPKAPVRHLEDITAEQVIKCIMAIYKYRGQEIYNTTQSTAILYALLSLLVRTATWDQAVMPPGWTGAIHFQKAVNFIAENYTKPISVKDIVSHVNLSCSYLYRIFLQQTSMSPQQYLMEYRIREAHRLLESRSGSVKEIAYAVGMEDPYSFSIHFKQICGKTPKEYMKYLIALEKNKAGEK